MERHHACRRFRGRPVPLEQRDLPVALGGDNRHRGISKADPSQNGQEFEPKTSLSHLPFPVFRLIQEWFTEILQSHLNRVTNLRLPILEFDRLNPNSLAAKHGPATPVLARPLKVSLTVFHG